MSLGGGSADIEESELDKETARISREKYDYLRPQLLEAEDTYIESVRGMNDASEYKSLANEVKTGVSAEFGEASGILTKNLAKAGVDPTSGKYQSTLETLSKDQGKAGADTVNRAQASQQDRALTSMGNVVAMGEGESASAIDGMFDVSQNANDYARSEANASLQRAQDRTSTLSFAAGIGYEASQGDG